MDHSLTGTFGVSDASEAETKAHAAARDYFGDSDYVIELDVTEVRTLGGAVAGYQVRYDARRKFAHETAPR